MADEPKLDIDDQAAVEAELARLKAGEQKPPTPPEDADTGIPPVDAPPAEPKKDDALPVEPKPDDAEARRKAEETWGQLKRELREARRRNDEMERQLREVKDAQTKPPADQPAPITKDENPVDYFDREITSLRQRLDQAEQVRQQRESQLEAQQQETRFAQEHPDYMKARDYLEKAVEREWEESGLANLHVNNLREMVKRGRAGEPQFKAYAEHVDRVAGWRDVQDAADKQNRDPEDMALWKVARDTHVAQEYAKEQQAAAAANRTIAENLYRRAQRVGYKPVGGQQQQTETGEQARQRVLNSQKIAEAANSLSEAGSTGDVEGKRIIKSRNDVLNMNDDELDALIASGRWKEL